MAKPPVAHSEPVSFWLAAPLVAAAMTLAPIPGWVVEQFYSRGIYPVIAQWLTAGSNLVPFALLDFFIIAALYLERFVPEGQPWVHLDMYAWNDNDRPGKPFGGEAQGLRAALDFLRARYA